MYFYKNMTLGIGWYILEASLVAQRIKRLPAMQETHVRSLGWENPLEKEMATHSSILAWRIQWIEELGRLQSTGSQRVGHDWVTSPTWDFRTNIRTALGTLEQLVTLISTWYQELNQAPSVASCCCTIHDQLSWALGPPAADTICRT